MPRAGDGCQRNPVDRHFDHPATGTCLGAALTIWQYDRNPIQRSHVSTKYAVEGYSQSLDHEVREHGVRILLVEPGPINTPFGAHSVQADTPLPLYESGRRNFEEVLAKNTSGGDDPAVVAKVIVAAASDRNPKLRRTAGSTAASISALHRVVPTRVFDRIIRRFNRMPS